MGDSLAAGSLGLVFIHIGFGLFLPLVFHRRPQQSERVLFAAMWLATSVYALRIAGLQDGSRVAASLMAALLDTYLRHSVLSAVDSDLATIKVAILFESE